MILRTEQSEAIYPWASGFRVIYESYLHESYHMTHMIMTLQKAVYRLEVTPNPWVSLFGYPNYPWVGRAGLWFGLIWTARSNIVSISACINAHGFCDPLNWVSNYKKKHQITNMVSNYKNIPRWRSGVQMDKRLLVEGFLGEPIGLFADSKGSKI